MLEGLLRYHMLSRNVLLCSCESIRQSQMILKGLIDNKYISEYKYRNKTRDTADSSAYYSITNAGINYLSSKTLYDEWKNGLRAEDFKNAFNFDTKQNQAARQRMANIGDAAFFAELATATVPLVLEREGNEPEGTVTYSSLIRNAYRSYSPEQYIRRETIINSIGKDIPSDTFRFLDVSRIKSDAKQTLNPTTVVEKYDINNGTYTGLIETEWKSALIYHPTGMGIRWDQYLADDEKTMLRLWSIENGIPKQNVYHTGGETWGILLVKNIRHFESLYFDRAKKRFKEKRIPSQDNLGKDFTHFVAIPISFEGNCELTEYMLMDDAKEEESECSQLLQRVCDTLEATGEWQRTAMELWEESLIRKSDGRMFTIVPYLDILTLRRIEIQSYKRKMGIICNPGMGEWMRRIAAEGGNIEVIEYNIGG